jgi:Histone H1-like protein Hc1
MNRFSELKTLVDNLQDDFAKFYEKDNQAAGTRVRKGLQDLKDLAQSVREQVQEAKNEKKESK